MGPFVTTPSLTDGRIFTAVCLLFIFDSFSYLIGKSKVIWSDENFIGYGQCWVCGATSAEMAEPKGVLHDFAPKPGVCALGLDPLHLMMRSFDKFNNVAMHWDFKEWSCYGDDNKYLKGLAKQRLQDDFKTNFGRLVYIPRPGGGLTNTG